MTTENDFSQEQQDAYFVNGLCPLCGAPETCIFPWQEVDGFTESRDVIYHFCGKEWAEVSLRDIGHRFLEKQKLNSYELELTTQEIHTMRVLIRARNEAEAVSKAPFMEFEEIVEDRCHHIRVTWVDEQSVKPLEEQDSGE
jgi:hypothetical protein